MTCKYRVVVSIDGGGRYGVVPLRFLSYLEGELNALVPRGHVSNWVDLYAASSTSAIIAGALASSGNKLPCVRPSDLLHIYLHRGKHFLTPPKGPHSVQALNYVVEHFFGQLTLGQINKHFLFVAENAESGDPFLFTDIQQHLQGCTVAKMMLACSAAPGFLDTEVIAGKPLKDARKNCRNPSIMALNYARIFYPDDHIVLISIGTGGHNRGNDDQSLLADKELRENKLLGDKLLYFRFNPVLNDKDTSNEGLLASVDNHIVEYQPQLNRLLQLMEIKAGRLL